MEKLRNLSTGVVRGLSFEEIEQVIETQGKLPTRRIRCVWTDTKGRVTETATRIPYKDLACGRNEKALTALKLDMASADRIVITRTVSRGSNSF